MNKTKGISLIETLIGLALMLTVFIGLLSVLRLGINIVAVSRARVGALALASEQMESIRNLPYEEVDVFQEEFISINDVNYTRRALVKYIDDEDGVGSDYKRVKVEVSWESKSAVQPVILISDIMP